MKRTMSRMALLGALALGGCAVIKVPQQAGVDPSPLAIVEYGQEAEEVLSLLSYYHKVLALPAEEQRKEYGAVNQAYAKDKSEKERLRLAILLSIPNSGFRDDTRLIGLLEGAATRSGLTESPRRNLIALLLRQVQERNRLAAQATQANQARDAARDQAREQAEKEQKRFEALVQDEKRRADELQQKLDALLAIERELRSRPPGRTKR